MKAAALKSAATVLTLVCGLTACGGGGDDASGAPGDLSLTPAEVTFTFDGADCTPDATFPGVTTVLINGGAGNYSVASTTDDLIVSPVRRVNGVYQFTFTKSAAATCYPDSGAILQVTDVRKNKATLKVVAKTASSP
jgi:hypothetical protein